MQKDLEKIKTRVRHDFHKHLQIYFTRTLNRKVTTQ